MKAFIFDLDGTLNDSVPLIVITTLKAYQELGIDQGEDIIKSYIGVPLVETGEALLGPGRGQEYLEAYLRHYDPLVYPMQAFPGIPELLSELRARGAKLAIATAKRRQMAEDTLEIIGLTGMVDVLVASESTERRKPFPDPALKAMELLAAKPAESLFIGDSIHDLQCAQQAGIKACAVTWGAGAKEALAACCPDYSVDTVAELSQLLLDLCS